MFGIPLCSRGAPPCLVDVCSCWRDLFFQQHIRCNHHQEIEPFPCGRSSKPVPLRFPHELVAILCICMFNWDNVSPGLSQEPPDKFSLNVREMSLNDL